MTLLNEADKIRLGSSVVTRVYVGATKVWPDFDPTVIPGLAGWYDASQLALADGAPVTTWPDLSGNGTHLIATPGYPYAPGTAPICKTNVLNGMRAVRYALNGTDLMVSPVVGVYAHFFVVCKFNGAAFPDYNGLISGVGDNTYFLIGTAGSSRFYPGDDAGWGATSYRLNGAIDALRTAPMNVWAQISKSITVPWTMNFQLGIDRTYPPRYWHGDIAEVIAYDHPLSDVERQQVEGYLHDKWGL